METDHNKDYFKGFRYFWQGIKEASKEIWISLEVLVTLTFVLALLIYLVEHPAQPEVYSSLWDSIVWSFMAYLDHPWKIAPEDPITLAGRLLWILVGLLKIALFAVPAGLIANGFNVAMTKDERKKELADLRDRLVKSFNRRQTGGLQYRTVPRNVSLATLQAKYGMDTKDVNDAIKQNSGFRLRNLAGCIPDAEHPADRLVVEHFPLTEGTGYGCKIDRNSNVTIVSTSSVSEAGIGNFSYYLAYFGGFNYISKEIESNPDEPISFYNIPDNLTVEDSQRVQSFIDDLVSLNRSNWMIFILSAAKQAPDVHLLHGAKKGDQGFISPDITVSDIESYRKFSDRLINLLKTQYDYSTGIQDKANSSYMFIGRRVREKKPSVNCFTVLFSYSITIWSNQNINVAVDIAKTIKEELDPEHPFAEKAEWKEHGYGYKKE